MMIRCNVTSWSLNTVHKKWPIDNMIYSLIIILYINIYKNKIYIIFFKFINILLYSDQFFIDFFTEDLKKLWLNTGSILSLVHLWSNRKSSSPIHIGQHFLDINIYAPLLPLPSFSWHSSLLFPSFLATGRKSLSTSFSTFSIFSFFFIYFLWFSRSPFCSFFPGVL